MKGIEGFPDDKMIEGKKQSGGGFGPEGMPEKNLAPMSPPGGGGSKSPNKQRGSGSMMGGGSKKGY